MNIKRAELIGLPILLNHIPKTTVRIKSIPMKIEIIVAPRIITLSFF
jgi:hypothetical protein